MNLTNPCAKFFAGLDTFCDFGRQTEVSVAEGITYKRNQFWTAGQRQAHSLHEISYRGCFKAELPAFFIGRLTSPNDVVYDPFCGRGTTVLQASMMGRRAIGNDINPLSQMLVQPRLGAIILDDVKRRLGEIPWDDHVAELPDELFAFYHSETLKHLCNLRSWLITRQQDGSFDQIDAWIRMVSLNRLTGHSAGFFSGYTLPPNQAVSVISQQKINAKLGVTPPYKDIPSLVMRKSKSLLKDGSPTSSDSRVLVGLASNTPLIDAHSVDLVVTSPPFLDVIDYKQDNWLRCWFANIDPGAVAIDQLSKIDHWVEMVRKTLTELARVVRPDGCVAFEVGEVRGGKILLEQFVWQAAEGLPFERLGVLVNDGDFTKTANIWKISNNNKGTNTNRVVILRRV